VSSLFANGSMCLQLLLSGQEEKHLLGVAASLAMVPSCQGLGVADDSTSAHPPCSPSMVTLLVPFRASGHLMPIPPLLWNPVLEPEWDMLPTHERDMWMHGACGALDQHSLIVGKTGREKGLA
jgi:hypothetical protein